MYSFMPQITKQSLYLHLTQTQPYNANWENYYIFPSINQNVIIMLDKTMALEII